MPVPVFARPVKMQCPPCPLPDKSQRANARNARCPMLNARAARGQKRASTYIRLGSNVRDVRYKVEVLTNDDPICGLFKNSFVFDLHLPPFRPF